MTLFFLLACAQTPDDTSEREPEEIGCTVAGQRGSSELFETMTDKGDPNLGASSNCYPTEIYATGEVLYLGFDEWVQEPAEFWCHMEPGTEDQTILREVAAWMYTDINPEACRLYLWPLEE